MSKKLRYRLQIKVPIARPNVLGNHSFPVHTYQWKDIAASDDREALVKVMPNDRDYRIEDTAPYTEEKKSQIHEGISERQPELQALARALCISNQNIQ